MVLERWYEYEYGYGYGYGHGYEYGYGYGFRNVRAISMLTMHEYYMFKLYLPMLTMVPIRQEG